MGHLDVTPVGDSAVLIRFGDAVEASTHARIMAFADHLEAVPIPGMVECVPAFTTVTVFYDPCRASYSEVKAELLRRLTLAPAFLDREVRVVKIPVCYGGEFGPDLEDVAAHHDLTAEEVVRIHTAGEYTVYAIGFAPGFPYLGGMSERIATPRLATPRLAIPAGSVGIAGGQTGVYPIETPGGWRLIGRTPLRLFRPEDDPPSLLAAGDRVRFYAIDRDEYDRLAAGDDGG
ncbi:MAG: 5-oxoprolinase subunit PxpB [Kyrpidia tusciae]|nr:5-oxoprolinase subunit PxpB [Kyrpidia tusciae]MBE3552565.1 5-oxoprolinase subunit PxpB [Kyrpidia tusciae]